MSYPSPLQYHPDSHDSIPSTYTYRPSYSSSSSSRSAETLARDHEQLLISHWPPSHRSSGSLSPNRLLDKPTSARPIGNSLKHLRPADFDQIKTLGTGTFARVWLTRWTHPHDERSAHQVYALKILHKVDVIRLKQVEHVRNERNVLAAVAGHPFITTLVASFQDEESLYMLLDYCPGGEVFSYLRRARRFNEPTSRFYAAEIVLILEYLHEKEGVAYRDLKPENILIDADGHLKLVDFGFAKTVGNRETYTLCGTPEYLAPEVIRNTGHGCAVDWWAFGILIYEFLVGQPPFWDQNPMKIYEQIIEGNIRYPSAMSPDARDLIAKLCTVDTSKRLGNIRGRAAAVKAHPWFRGVDWDAVFHRKMQGPIVPQLQGPADTRHFDEYEPEPEKQEVYTRELREKYEEAFKDF
ncbi:Pkinase-domain-containing protein [Eremomyces bilateralis CBS 781.70]|uniref:cAMP-dependent protein kinase n=1 Tax=Eremomyces bilateralis CBS 781.70 TaxID=1392243 RepID=A0A6G1GDX8_9PEZI|nr:Pkinase-domain-containing protein [Eremomyces bilateralis CBS 781.70]KAF1816091.1 Pkinase-domain-containing protein [Eremomyces bilateralis CBS 781.70]